jgi:hypothetical protein
MPALILALKPALRLDILRLREYDLYCDCSCFANLR